jgi:hypothetical protein
VGQPSCTEFNQIVDTIKKNNEAATAVRKALTGTFYFVGKRTVFREDQREKLRDALVAYREANVVLNKIMRAHKKACPKCMKEG